MSSQQIGVKFVKFEGELVDDYTSPVIRDVAASATLSVDDLFSNSLVRIDNSAGNASVTMPSINTILDVYPNLQVEDRIVVTFLPKSSSNQISLASSGDGSVVISNLLTTPYKAGVAIQATLVVIQLTTIGSGNIAVFNS